MNKQFATAAAALFATLAVAASTVPANAGGGFSIGIGGGGHGGHGFHDYHHGGVTFGFNSGPSHRHLWRKHVRWCFNHHASYDPDSNRYFNGHRWRRCNSPFI